MIKVSIVIPCYNSGKYIQRCFESFENQTFSAFEIIVVDDCSTDNSVEIIQAYKVKTVINITLIRNKENYGPSKSRKIGVQAAKGKFIAFCDSDDTVNRRYIESMISIVNQKKCDLLFCNYSIIHEDGKEIKRNRLDLFDEKDKKSLIALGPDSMCGLFASKELYENIVFPDLRNGEDMAIVPILVAKAQNIAITEEFFYQYRHRKGSLSQSKSDSMIEDIWKSTIYVKEMLDGYFREECEFLAIRNYLYGSMLHYFRWNSETEPANEILQRFQENYENWKNNKYYKKLPIYKMFFLYFVKHRKWKICKIIAQVHIYLTT